MQSLGCAENAKSDSCPPSRRSSKPAVSNCLGCLGSSADPVRGASPVSALLARSPKGFARLGSVSSLALIVAGALDRLSPGMYLASLDALRGERYGALIEVRAEPSRDGQPAQQGERRISWDGSWHRDSTSGLTELAHRSGAVMIGPDEALCAWPDAAGLVHLWGIISEADPASWEPDYGRLAEAEVRLEAKSSRP